MKNKKLNLKQRKLKARNTIDRMMRMKDNGFRSTTQVHEGEVEYSRSKEKIEFRKTISDERS